jgi:hypothetical protein
MEPAGRLAIASLVMGVSSLTAFFCFWPVAFPLSILGVIFGVMGLKSSQRTLAIVGLVASSLGAVALLGIGALFLVLILL